MRFFLLCGLSLLVNVLQAQTLFTFGSNKVTSEEFSRAFRKNNTGNKDEKALREYLDLYTRFKLKVQAAKDLRMDTLSNLKNDIAGFRAQISEQYLEKNTYTKQMIQEAYQRGLTEVEAAHIFVAYEGDSVAAKNKIDAAYQELKKGTDFGTTSRNYSTDPYVKATDGYLDFISVFSLPYELETIVYTLQPGSYSTPVAGKKGWHIFKTISTRKNSGELLASQILFAIPENASQEEKSAIQATADSVYGLLVKGMNFEEAAEKFSNDKYTFQNGGSLQEFHYTDCDPIFARAAFGLKKDGEITKPFKTNNGWHILKRISLKENKKDLSDPETQQAWGDKVNGNSRIQLVNQRYQEQIRKLSGYNALPYNKEELWTLSDSLLETDQYTKMYKDHKSKKIFQLQDKSVSASDWFQFLKNKQSESNGRALNGYDELMKEFTNTTIEQYHKDKLEKTNPEFRLQMQEFTEGSLLFEVMEKTIWSKAPVDSAGLLKHYEDNRSKYLWGASADAIIFNCSDSATANKAYKLMQGNSQSWQTYIEQLGGYALADSSRFELTQLPVSGKELVIKPGMLTSIESNSNDGSASFCYIIRLYPDKEQRDFNAAKGLVINDYQQVLEEKWIASLKKKYPVVVNEVELKKLISTAGK
jgi:peptidyl-prolyl cis-trans isomerase SurA